MGSFDDGNVINPPPFNEKEVILFESTCIDQIRIVQVLLFMQNVIVEAAPIPANIIWTPFKFVVLVTNFKIIDSNNQMKENFKETPFQLRVEYTEGDWQILTKENNRKNRGLAYWDGQVWVEYPGVWIDTVDGNPATGGFLYVRIDNWVDPPIGIV
jgi:hypothetical protein